MNFFLNIFFENEVEFEGFKCNISDFLIWFSVCSQKDRKMIKDLYVIFDLQLDFVESFCG